MHRQYSYEEALECVDLLCRAILGRPADGEGWAWYARSLASGQRTEEEIGKEFISSAEFFGRGRLPAVSQPDHGTVFIQTADPHVYREMLDITSRTVLAYCRRHNFRYESYTGVKRGFWPWHATYNRLFILKELMDRGFRGWAIYMDADAYIADQQFDLRGYLADKSDCALIAVLVPGKGPENINAGVLFVNLDHPVGRAITAEWHQRYMDIPDYIVRQADVFELGMESDQALLITMLENPHYLRHLHHESPDLINSGRAAFIRQQLRAMHASSDDRLAVIAKDVDAIMAASSDVA